MKNRFCYTFFLTLLFVIVKLNSIAQNNSEWNKKNAAEWFEKHEWLSGQKGGESAVKYDQFGRIIDSPSPDTHNAKTTYLDLQQLKPHESINKVDFAKQYHANKLWWSEAFAFLKETDLANLKPGKYAIDGDNVFATVTDGPPKREDTTNWESHKNYLDIHYVIKGQEKIGVAPVASAKIIKEYNEARDIIFYTSKGNYYAAHPGNFFIFFPQDAHRPGLPLKVVQDNIKKIVLKIRVAKL